MEQKRIDYEATFRADKSQMALIITNQTHRSGSFGKKDCDYWLSSQGYKLTSCSYPALGDDDDGDDNNVSMFVRGSNHDRDNEIVLIDFLDFKAFTEAVDEYNKEWGNCDNGYKLASVNLDSYINSKITDLEMYQKKILKAGSNKEILQVKTDLIVNLTRIPTQERYCPYCIEAGSITDETCGKCKYGKANGICTVSTSCFRIIDTKVKDLRTYVEANYPIKK